LGREKSQPPRSWLRSIDFAVFQRARFVENLPLADFLSVVVATFVYQLAVVVIALPQAHLLAILEFPGL
jgi:hypothetical protein